jgi:N-acyl-D-aspartate/D-glutamate deacylase
MVLQILESDSETGIVNYGINEQDVRFVMQQPWVATASDGSAKIPGSAVPHPRNYGTFPRKIGHYSVREKVISVSDAIRSATGLPADILGLSDRGYLRVGLAADIAVWSEEKLIDKATFEFPDRYSEGIEYLFVNGVPAMWDGQLTGAMAGQTLKHRSRLK